MFTRRKLKDWIKALYHSGTEEVLTLEQRSMLFDPALLNKNPPPDEQKETQLEDQLIEPEIALPEVDLPNTAIDQELIPPSELWARVLTRVDQIYDKIAVKADQRYGGGWSTGSCVVGSDMRSGLAEARPIAISYQYQHDLSLDKNIQSMAGNIIEAASCYPFHDSEGCAAGTMMQMGSEIGALRAKNLK